MQTEYHEESALEKVGDATKTGLAVIGLITVVVSALNWKKVRKAYKDAQRTLAE